MICPFLQCSRRQGLHRLRTMNNTYLIERPNIVSGQQYVQWTEYHQAAAAMLPPSSVHLWQYLRKDSASRHACRD